MLESTAGPIEMSRIAILTSEFLPFHGGIGTYARELATASEALGHRVTVFAPDYGEDFSAADCQRFRFEVCRFKAGLRSPFSYPRYAHTCLKVAGCDKFDRILAADIPFVEMMAVTYPLHRRLYDAMTHGSDINKERLSLRGFLLRPAQVFHRPNRIFANSYFTRALLLRRYPTIKPERVIVTHLGISPEWFDPPTEIRDIRRELGIEGGRAVIATVARITPRKGQLNLLKAVTRLPYEIRRRLSLVLAGSSSELHDRYVREVRAAAAEAAPAQVVLPGSLSDDAVKGLYRMAVAFCLPGTLDRIEVEGFGLVILEAAAQGLPSIASAVGGASELIRDGETGILVQPDDHEGLAAALRRVVEDRHLRESLGRQAAQAAQEYTWDRCARQTFGPNGGFAAVTNPLTADGSGACPI